MPSQDQMVQAQAVIASLFEVPVGVGVRDPRGDHPALLGREGAHLTKAIAKRLNEFAAGRAAARTAMAALGVPPQAIPSHKDRSPIWPAGITGSISHKGKLCAAVVSRVDVTLGLDIEEDSALDLALLPSICTPSEIARTTGPDQGHMGKLIFSAKEAAYKAQYPRTQQLFGFDHMEIDWDLPNHAFAARFVKPVAMFDVGDRLPGRFGYVAGHLVTAVTLGQGAAKEA